MAISVSILIEFLATAIPKYLGIIFLLLSENAIKPYEDNF